VRNSPVRNSPVFVIAHGPLRTAHWLLAGALAWAGCGPSAEAVRLRRHVALIESALEAFVRDCGRAPTQGEGLPALVRRPFSPDVTDRWRGPYLRPDQIRDPWERLYAYASVVREDGTVELRVWAVGLDGVPDTADDGWPSGRKPLPTTRPSASGPQSAVGR
jgi:hypothetical protein